MIASKGPESCPLCAQLKIQSISVTSHDASYGTDQFDILRFKATEGSNREVSLEDIIHFLQPLDQAFGVDITSAWGDGLDFVLKRIPDVAEARRLRRRLLKFCPDIKDFPLKNDLSQGWVGLQWD